MRMAGMATSRARPAVLDPACSAAVDLARQAAVVEAGDAELVGEWLAATSDGDRLVTHSFASRNRAYRGWRWAVTVTRASRAKNVTVDEVVLLPGEEALLALEWVPWSERLRPGDLGVGDLMITTADDERLAPAYASADDPEQEAVAFSFGLGRVRVLSADGRDEAVERWYAGASGPSAPIAMAAPGRCATCGFWVPVRGDLGQLFGACANEYAPDDSRVVSADHGCGAHSEAVVSEVVVSEIVASGVVASEEPLIAVTAVAGTGNDAEELGHS